MQRGTGDKWISIHAARVGCDRIRIVSYLSRHLQFQSTQPEWAATIENLIIQGQWLFQSTQPEWAATLQWQSIGRQVKFQSKQPEWAATRFKFNPLSEDDISIHAARVGCDYNSCSSQLTQLKFQSTQPQWAATYDFCPTEYYLIFQSTQPEWAATLRKVIIKIL